MVSGTKQIGGGNYAAAPFGADALTRQVGSGAERLS